MIHLSVSYLNPQGQWAILGRPDMKKVFQFKNDEIEGSMTFRTDLEDVHYTLCFEANFPTRIKLSCEAKTHQPWHLIPCCIHGDNNLDGAKPGQYPNLTERYPEERYSSPYWEFRADRASHPISALLGSSGSFGISIDPFCDDENGQLVRNGLFAELPNVFGVTCGYANLPYTFINKKTPEDDGLRPSTHHHLKKAKVSGTLFISDQKGLRGIAPMVDKLYRNYRIRPEYKKSFDAAARALLDAFVQQNWSDSFGHYTNQYCTIEDDSRMKPWRGLYEIAWTGGVIQGYPFLRANDLLRLATDFFDGCKDGMTLLNEVAKSLNPKSGLFYDLTRPLEGSRVNGWWSPMKVTWDCHAAYTNGQALYYLFLAMDHCQKKRIAIPELWEKNAQIVADRLVALQRDDGCCGYAYYSDRAEVSDWDGFAGCWVAAAFAAAYRYTKKEEYGEAASKGMHYYRDDILACQANGTPMDTWKSPDEEGNIAFIKGARLMHMISGDPQYLEMLEEGAQYEYLWRYGFKGHPEFAPLKGSGYNSCGGSITSVSNPHQHPMGLLVTEDLYYLADHTDQEVHRHRADDGIAWAMQCLELYPKISGYGQYGVVTERFCPSDGLTIESYPDGNPASMWFSYNGWAAANILEAILSVIEYQSQDKKKSGGQ